MALPAQARAVVTGAGSGLGRALCIELGSRGARVIASDVDLAAAEETARMLPSDARPVRCDVSRAEDVEALAQEADRFLGGVDLLVNNAGVAVAGAVGDVPLSDWKWVVDVNLWGVIHGCHAFVPRMRRQGSGHVLNVASAAGLLAAPKMAPYNVTKAAVVSLSETLYGELQGSGIGVSVLCPTFFQTNILASGRSSDTSMNAIAEKLMREAKIQASDVARIALDAVGTGELYVLPHGDGRWFWRLKRAAPGRFHSLVPRLMALRAGRGP